MHPRAMSYPRRSTTATPVRSPPGCVPPTHLRTSSTPTARRSTTSSTGASTEGHFGLYRWNMAPGPGGPDLHFHRTISETFFILSGTVTLGDGAKTVAARPGDHLYVPPWRPAQLQERHRRAGLDAAAVLAGCPTRGILRGPARLAERMKNVSLIVRWKCRSGAARAGRHVPAVEAETPFGARTGGEVVDRRAVGVDEVRQVCRSDAGGRRPRRSRRGRSASG